MVVRSEASLVNVAVTARDKNRAAELFLLRGSGGKKIIRLEARHLRIVKAAGGNEFRQHQKLLEQGIVEFPSALISRKFLMPVGGDL